MGGGGVTARPALAVPRVVVHLGDCLEVMRALPDNSLEAVVCDPPYGLSREPDIAEVLRHWLAGDDYEHGGSGFMGREWDSFVPGPAYWSEALRVVKPGGHLIAFAGQRTLDLMGIALRMGGWQVRDLLGWTYFSGFPKSLDVSKALDREAGAEREPDIYTGPNGKNAVYGSNMGGGVTLARGTPSTPAAIRWQGFGTAIKPAIEPAILCRKPITEGSIARNVLRWGTGALNIDGCRFAHGDPAWAGPQEEPDTARTPSVVGDTPAGMGRGLAMGGRGHSDGRFPANLYACPKASRSERERGCDGLPATRSHDVTGRDEGSAGARHARSGMTRAGEIRNVHPTVKPVRLLRWLCRLVTPPGGTVLDPFAGSGSCGVAAALEGLGYVGAEVEPDYHRIAEARIAHALRWPSSWGDTAPGGEGKVDDDAERAAAAGQVGLFGAAK